MPVPDRTPVARALPVLVLGAALIGLVPIGVRLALTGDGATLGPLSVAFWRFALAAPLLWWWSARARGDGAPPRRGLLAGCGLLFACDIGCYFVAIQRTSVANATLLSNFAPLFVAAGAALMGRASGGLAALGGALIAIAGGALLVVDQVRFGAPASLVGDAFGLLSAAFYGGYQLAIASLRRDQPAVRIMAAVATVGALVLAPVALVAGEALLPARGRDWAVLVMLAVVTQIGGQGLITWALAHLAPVFSSVVLLVQPVVAAALAWWLFGEAFGALQGLGAALVLAGILVARPRG